MRLRCSFWQSSFNVPGCARRAAASRKRGRTELPGICAPRSHGRQSGRIRVVKGWLDTDGKSLEKFYDVVWAGDRKVDASGKLPPMGNTVDRSISSWTNTVDAPELCFPWTDPDFDSSLRAFYYARFIESPTLHWTAHDYLKFGLNLPAGIPLKTQERACILPIDLDIKGFFDNIDDDLLMLAVKRHTDCKWVLLYIQRWLQVPAQLPDGILVERDKKTPQGG